MTASTAVASADLRQQVQAALSESQMPLTDADVARIVTEIVRNTDVELTQLDLKVFQEIDSLAKYIQAAKAEIAAIRPDEIRDDFVPSATDELDAVVAATEEATGTILDNAEKVMEVAGELEEPTQSNLIEMVTAIFEACNFQDITGQRITKVVTTLKHIDERIQALASILGDEVDRATVPDAVVEVGSGKLDDEDLLNGPQLPNSAIDQDEIDKLMADFD